LREHAVQLFLRLMERAAATGVEPAMRWALRILAVDPVHEPAHRGLMELYAAQGRHAAALRQYEQLRETLSREWPDYQTALRIAAASNALAGCLEEARNARERLQKLDPKLRISNLGDELGPYHRPQDIVRYVEGLRKAGLPH
jgi:DNA-binding SARP family transcriptional activator